MVSLTCGQLMGTAAGNYSLCSKKAAGSEGEIASLGVVGASLLICLARGLWETDRLDGMGRWLESQ